MNIIIDNQYMSVFEKSNILTLCWKNETSNFDDEKFKNEALRFASVVEKENSKYIIVDMRKFNFILSEELVNWRNKNIISLYNKIGVKKFAFISEKPAVKQDNPENTFTTQTFLTTQEAEVWLKD